MSTEAIAATTFIREYTRELHNKNAAVFADNDLSMTSGYVDWKALLREIIQDLGLDPDKEHDLVTLAQYHCNQAGRKQNKAHSKPSLISSLLPKRQPRAIAFWRAASHSYLLDHQLRQIDQKALEDAGKV